MGAASEASKPRSKNILGWGGVLAAFLHPMNSSTLCVLFDYNVIRKECLSKNVISNISIGSIVIVEIRYLLIAKVSKKDDITIKNICQTYNI